MDRNQIEEVLKYSDPKTLYVVTWNHLLKCLYCPFKVVVKHDVGELLTNEIRLVEAVRVTMELITVYQIEGQLYYYYHFEIIVE